MKETLKLGFSLALVCALAGAVLAYANIKTQAPISQAESREKEQALALVLPEFANSPIGEKTDPLEGVVFFPARDSSGKVIAVAAEGSSTLGFGGQITILASLNPDDDTITHVVVTSHKETPGLGTKAIDRKVRRSVWHLGQGREQAKNLPPNAYLDRYSSAAVAAVGAAGFKVVTSQDEVGPNAVLAVTGATISSNAVADAIHHICDVYQTHRDDIVK